MHCESEFPEMEFCVECFYVMLSEMIVRVCWRHA